MKGSFSFEYNDIQSLYAVPAVVYNSDMISIHRDVTAIIDTGSDCSLICNRLIEELQLEKVGEQNQSSAQGNYKGDIYYITFQCGLCRFEELRVISANIDDIVDFIIGTDILSQGNLSITNNDDKTKIHFEIND